MIAAIRNQFCISIGSTSSRVEMQDAPGHEQADRDVGEPPISAISTKPSRRPT